MTTDDTVKDISSHLIQCPIINTNSDQTIPFSYQDDRNPPNDYNLIQPDHQPPSQQPLYSGFQETDAKIKMRLHHLWFMKWNMRTSCQKKIQ
jgi:hypothetical protein